ncbi:hypothetical protein WCWAEYFT_CDS0154 [Vibrio phage VB_VaC_TDDLMA]
MINIYEYVGCYSVPRYRIENTERGECCRFESFETFFTQRKTTSLGLSAKDNPDYKLIRSYDTMQEFREENCEWFI